MTARALAFAAAFPAVAALASALYFRVRAGEAVHLLDDPMITLRVARTLWEHGVPYFNPGEAVAANTSLFWPILLAPVFGVWSDPEAAVQALFVGSTLLWTGLACWLGARQPDALTGIATVVFIAFGAWGRYYGGSAWEHVPQAVCVAAGFAIWLGGRRGAAGPALGCFWLLAASFLFRPDSAPLVAGFWLIQLAALDGAERRRFVALSLPALALPALYAGGMLAFYGDLVPNTYYLKSATLPENLAAGVVYLLDPVESGPVPMLALILVLLSPRLRRRERAVVGLILLQIATVVALGGDIYDEGRFLLVVLPTAASLAILHLSRLIRPAPALLLAVVAAGWTLVSPSVQRKEAALAAHLYGQVQIVRALDPILAPGDGSLGLHFLGIGYHLPDIHVVDYLGKADPVIARLPPREGLVGHNKWDYGYSLSAYDIAATPVPASAHRAVADGAEPADAASDGSDGTEDAGWQAFARAVLATDAYVFVGPERFCFPTSYGLYLRRDLADRLARIERDVPAAAGGGRCLGAPDRAFDGAWSRPATADRP